VITGRGSLKIPVGTLMGRFIFGLADKDKQDDAKDGVT
jgi:hypothetical protein